jgi:phosphoglycerate transport regulatory protein PgtC
MKNIVVTLVRRTVFAVLAAVLWGGAATAQQKLTIVTSFSSELTDVYKAAFEKAYPGVTVEIVNKSTNVGVKFLQETARNNGADIFWASAPDAFEVLKKAGLLAKYKPSVPGIPEKIGSYPLNDPDGFYSGFALSGYGIMWNTRYMSNFKLEVPKEWSDLTAAKYFGHVGTSSPARSGTTHLTIETIIQGEGWEKGWEQLKFISGNAKTITERSFGVPDGVNSGAFGIGLVIDFFGLSSKASGFPVDFHYPKVTTLVPASAGIITNAPNAGNAQKFIEFLVSEAGQMLLLEPKIMRLPVNPLAYAKAPKDFPNPFSNAELGSAVTFDIALSEARYNVVNALFDVMVTYRLDKLQTAVRAIHDAESSLAGKGSDQTKALIAEARALVAKMPVTAEKAGNPEFAAVFTQLRKKPDEVLQGRQAEFEREWDAQVVANYAKAVELARQAAATR